VETHHFPTNGGFPFHSYPPYACYAYYFNGNHQEIVVPTKPITDQLTYSVWFNLNSFSLDHATTVLHRQHESIKNNETIRINSSTHNLAFYLVMENGTHRALEYGNFVNRKNEWIHIVATYDGRIMRLFENGELVAEQDFGSIGFLKRNTTPFTIGGERDNGLPIASFNGFIDDVHIYNRAISSKEVNVLYQGNFQCDGELLAKLNNFTATAIPNGILLEWDTATERRNAGFHIWRAKMENGEYTEITRITAQLIPAEGNSRGGASYSYEDASVVPGNIYAYLLEDVDSKGKSTYHWKFIDSATVE